MAQEVAPEALPVARKMESLRRLAGGIRATLDRDMDVVLAWTGPERVGKSTGALHLARLLNGGLDLKRDVIYDPEEFLKAILTYESKSCIVADESMALSYKREAMTYKNRALNRAFAEIGRRNLCVVLALPNFSDLDVYLRGWRVRLWLHTYERGKAVVFTRDKSPFTSDPWRMAEREAHYLVMRQIGYAVPVALRAVSGCVAHITFPPLSPDMDAAYRRHKEAGLQAAHEEEREKREEKREAKMARKHPGMVWRKGAWEDSEGNRAWGKQQDAPKAA